MSFCYLLNAVLLFTGVVVFIIAGFAGTFSRRLHGCRYRLMLAPLGFVILGSLSRSITTRLVLWLMSGVATPHVGHLGSGAEIFESAVLLLAGLAGVLAGVALGSTLDRVQTHEQTYTIANYWNRRRTGSSGRMPAASTRRENVVAISTGKKQPGAVRRVNAASEND